MSGFGLDFWLAIAALIVGVVAIPIALPPFLQMMCGKPKVRIKFDTTVEQNTKLLLCCIFNVPIRHWFLQRIGVTRLPTDVFASFDIREHGTNRIIASAFRAKLWDSKSNTEGLALTIRPPLPIVFTIVTHPDQGAFSTNNAPSLPQDMRLQPGEYIADVSIASDEQTVRKVAQSFTVAPHKDATDWTSRKINEDW
jgi:hypothetical protein